ncbi:nuclear transport factor 2 family protein [Marinomonas shanghaiensis]|uniref:nuclear transport factor 2 family protein n=1 Tax=Marinomonas shanghaiensis TaxID=2202418 RepID=UPI003A90956C
MEASYYSVDESLVLQAHLSRAKALIEQNMNVLADLSASTLRYVHATGRVDNRDSYLKFVPSVKYINIETNDRNIVLIGDVAIISGAMTMCLYKQGNDTPNYPKSYFMEVWKQYGKEWKLILFQSTAVPA